MIVIHSAEEARGYKCGTHGEIFGCNIENLGRAHPAVLKRAHSDLWSKRVETLLYKEIHSISLEKYKLDTVGLHHANWRTI